jgi:hypothetical protein
MVKAKDTVGLSGSFPVALRASGVLSDAEFEAQKRRILGET